MGNIAERLKKLRAEKRLTQENLGKCIGVSKQAIANIESGHNNPSLEFLSKLNEILSVNLNWFIMGQGNMFNQSSFEDVEEIFVQKVDAILKSRGLI